ncbi:MAG TPA: cyclophilin-like fold protein [Oscillospiraceae bacterium]|nr:cyclophilin-like fold protein [Oscillospiraceae bacterium]
MFASRYGGFGQVGSLPQSFSRNDVQTTMQAGDIVLYSGNQLVIFFGSNSWSYTKLGHIKGMSADELAVLLDKEQTVIELQLKSK